MGGSGNHAHSMFKRIRSGDIESSGNPVPAKTSIDRCASPVAQEILGVFMRQAGPAVNDKRSQPDAR